jgi:hypothetical protein
MINIMEVKKMTKQSKRQKRADWLKTVADDYKKSFVPEYGSRHNARNRRGMSYGGYGYWIQAIELAGLPTSKMRYWSGSLPTCSMAINKGYADFIDKNAPAELR